MALMQVEHRGQHRAAAVSLISIERGMVAVILASSGCAWGTRFILLPVKASGWTLDFYCAVLVQLLFRSHKR